MTAQLIALAAPASLALAGTAALFSRGPRPRLVPVLAEAAALIALVAVIGSAVVLGLEGGHGLGLGLRLDALSVPMLILVTFVGWVVVRYTRTYLDGEPRQGVFTGWLLFTLAAVLMLVAAAGLVQLALAWIATSLFLHRLLLFYPHRVGARRAARKKFVTARLGDLFLVIAFALLWRGCGTTDIGAVLAAARSGTAPAPALLPLAAAFLALAAALKSAQFPSHTWLTEVMETPTPVSALLHAGVVNAGGFLLIRFADVMLTAPGVLAALVVVGGFTALFGSLVMLTQPAVKTSLAWSTVAQMGFMVFECGLGLFPLALLHILAHSLYKAHAFLSSGGAVEQVASIARPGPVATPKAGAVAQAFAAALVLYALVGFAFGFQHKSPQAAALGAILIFGVAYMLAQGFADAAPRALTRRTALYALATSIAYFTLQAAVLRMTEGLLPPPPPTGVLENVLIAMAVISFGLAAVVQAMFPLWAHHPAAAGLRTHLANGFYVNAIFDRMLGGWSVRRMF